MKKILAFLVLLLNILTIQACPPPTSHAIINIGATYDYQLPKSDWSKDNIGIGGSIGWEIPNRYVTFSATGSYIFGAKEWSAGGRVSINPLGILYGYDTPINPNIIIGSGYKSYNGVYANIGIELSGSMGKYITPYISCTYEANSLQSKYNSSILMSAGIRLWLGKDW